MSTYTEPRRAPSAFAPRVEGAGARCVQLLTVLLEGTTAGDYLAWARDPEPPLLGRGLRSVTVEADPLGERIGLELVWDCQPPAAWPAVAAAGFALTPEVVAVKGRRHPFDQPEETDMHNSHIHTALLQARVEDLRRAAARASDQSSVRSAHPAPPISIGALRERIARDLTDARPLRTHP